MYRHLNIDHQYKFIRGKVYIIIIEGFWSFVKEMLMKHPGICRENFSISSKKLNGGIPTERKNYWGFWGE
jgi:hypothetical protein